MARRGSCGEAGGGIALPSLRQCRHAVAIGFEIAVGDGADLFHDTADIVQHARVVTGFEAGIQQAAAEMCARARDMATGRQFIEQGETTLEGGYSFGVIAAPAHDIAGVFETDGAEMGLVLLLEQGERALIAVERLVEQPDLVIDRGIGAQGDPLAQAIAGAHEIFMTAFEIVERLAVLAHHPLLARAFQLAARDKSGIAVFERQRQGTERQAEGLGVIAFEGIHRLVQQTIDGRSQIFQHCPAVIGRPPETSWAGLHPAGLHMNGLAADGQCRFLDRFVMGGMAMEGAGDIFRRRLEFHRHNTLMDERAGARRQDIGAEKPVGLCISQQFDAAICIPSRLGTRVHHERELADLVNDARSLQFLFGLADGS